MKGIHTLAVEARMHETMLSVATVRHLAHERVWLAGYGLGADPALLLEPAFH